MQAQALTYDDDVRLAHVVADSAEAAAMQRYGVSSQQAVNGGVSLPHYGLPSAPSVPTHERSVSVTDQNHELVHAAIAQVLRRARPRDRVIVDTSALHNAGQGEPGTLGAESSPAQATAGQSPAMAPGAAGSRCWLVQPLAVGENLPRRIPVWATTLTLLDGPDVVAALVSAPALNRRWWAAKGSGAWVGRTLSSAKRCQVADTATLDQANLSTLDVRQWSGRERFSQFLTLAGRCARLRSYEQVWAYMLLAEGGLDVVAEPQATLYDLGAASLIASEAGAVFTDIFGNPGPAGGTAIAAVPALHAQVVQLLRQEVS